MVVLGTAKNRGTGAKPAPFTMSEFAVPKKSGTRTKILAVPCPERYSVNGVIVMSQICHKLRALYINN